MSRSRSSRKVRTLAPVLVLLLGVLSQYARTSGTTSARTTTGSNRSTTRTSEVSGSRARTERPADRASTSNRSDPRLRSIGFASASKLHQHYAKHGAEFGSITEAQYLARAQDLRDAPLSSSLLEAEQVGGTVSRFDRSSGAFLAFNHDLTIRTFFRPNDGESYFRRAAKRSH
jgi:hypothetical protein